MKEKVQEKVRSYLGGRPLLTGLLTVIGTTILLFGATCLLSHMMSNQDLEPFGNLIIAAAGIFAVAALASAKAKAHARTQQVFTIIAAIAIGLGGMIVASNQWNLGTWWSFAAPLVGVLVPMAFAAYILVEVTDTAPTSSSPANNGQAPEGCPHACAQTNDNASPSDTVGKADVDRAGERTGDEDQ